MPREELRACRDLLRVAAGASREEIARAFRLEMGKYHPDKVQHLGEELRRLAAFKAAELTRAYRTLITAESAPRGGRGGRSDHEYDERLTADDDSRERRDDEWRRTAIDGLIQRAALARLRRVGQQELGACVDPPAAGFHLAWKPARRFWEPLAPWVLVRMLGRIDAHTLADCRAKASNFQAGRRRVCVLAVGDRDASVGEGLSPPSGPSHRAGDVEGAPIIVTVSTRTWSAVIPSEAPPVVRALLARLESA